MLRYDNSSTCSVGNTDAAYRPTMRFALKTLLRVWEQQKVTVIFVYIPSRENDIADAIMRDTLPDSNIIEYKVFGDHLENTL